MTTLTHSHAHVHTSLAHAHAHVHALTQGTPRTQVSTRHQFGRNARSNSRSNSRSQTHTRARTHARTHAATCGYRPTCVGWNAESITPLCSVSGVCAAKLLTGTGRARSAVARVQSRRQTRTGLSCASELKSTQACSRVLTGTHGSHASVRGIPAHKGYSDCRAWLLRSISGFCMRSA